MPTFIISGVVHCEVEEESDDAKVTDAIRAFRVAHPRATITAINDRLVDGLCEACSAPCFEGEKYSYDEDGVYVCPACNKVEETK